MMNSDLYKADPCGASSLPFWKTNSFSLPKSVTVLREDAFTSVEEGYTDTVYFKMLHGLKGLTRLSVPEGYSLVSIRMEDFAAHISACYDEEGISPAALEQYRERDVYRADLWIALRDDRSGEISATGIAELDASIGEGVLEWIQVSPGHRRRGLGSFLVNELLFRMQGAADFVTVSGRMDNPTNPYALYQSCGFDHAVLWHVLR